MLKESPSQQEGARLRTTALVRFHQFAGTLRGYVLRHVNKSRAVLGQRLQYLTRTDHSPTAATLSAPLTPPTVLLPRLDWVSQPAYVRSC
jgi:hypothetical protein